MNYFNQTFNLMIEVDNKTGNEFLKIFGILFFLMFSFMIFTAINNLKLFKDRRERRYNSEVINKAFIKSTIFSTANIISKCFTVIIVSLFAYIFIKGFTLSLGTSDMSIRDTIIMISIVVFIFALFFIFIFKDIISDVLLYNAIKKNNFVIIEDEIVDMDIERHNGTEHVHVYYYFYFKNIYKRLNKRIAVSGLEYSNAKIDDKYYVIYIYTKNKFLVFNKANYSIDYDIRGKLVDFSVLENYYFNNKKNKQINTESLKYNDQYTKNYSTKLHNEDILRLYKKSDMDSYGNMIIAYIVILVFFAVGIAMIAAKSYLIGIIITGFTCFVSIFVAKTCLVKTKNTLSIKKGDYIIKSDIIESDNTDEHLKYSGEKSFFIMHNSGKCICCDKVLVGDVSRGNELYLFYLNNPSGKPSQPFDPSQSDTVTLKFMNGLTPEQLEDIKRRSVNYNNSADNPFLVINPSLIGLSNEILEKKQ